ncbi:MAG TPA: 2-phosphosulfolactate phosphatase [Steroidobacteraceae bacterium]|nr:2-phosphosulfolactate phosphatase [Steroidobacteraceae bacterium]
MRIEVLDFVTGAAQATGSAVVIDVFRAFTTACYAAAGGARVIPVAEIDTALALRARHPDWLLAGERYGRDLPGFDFGNSPARIEAASLRGRTLVHTTHAGTQGLTHAHRAQHVLTGSLVNAGAIARYLAACAPETVSLVRMGHQGRARSLEDDVCAELIAARLAGTDYETAGIADRLRGAPAAAQFFDPAATWAPERDFELCLAIDRFDFVLKLAPPDAEGLRALERISA